MRHIRLLLVLASCTVLSAQGTEQAAIQSVMQAQVAGWNRGDIPAFMQGYQNSPDTTFIGSTVQKGFDPILRRYQQAYSSPAQMGKLTFSNIDVRLLPSACGTAEYAIVTGRFHLERSAHGEATKDDGVFSLLWHKGAHGWKIILDHTS